MARGEIGENLPFLQLDQGVADVAVRLSTVMERDYRLLLGSLYVFWHGLAKRKRLYRALLLELRSEEPRMLLDFDELKVRLHMAFGFEVDPGLLVAVDVLELEPGGLFKVCGMDRYIDSERGRLKTRKEWPPQPDPNTTGTPPGPHPGPTPVAPRSHPGGTRNGVKPTVSVQSHPGVTSEAPGCQAGPTPVLPHATGAPPRCHPAEEEEEEEVDLKTSSLPSSVPVLRLVASPDAVPGGEEGDQLEPEEYFCDVEPFLAAWQLARKAYELGEEYVDAKTRGRVTPKLLAEHTVPQWRGCFLRYLDPKASKGAGWAQDDWPLVALLTEGVLRKKMPPRPPRAVLCGSCGAPASLNGSGQPIRTSVGKATCYPCFAFTTSARGAT